MFVCSNQWLYENLLCLVRSIVIDQVKHIRSIAIKLNTYYICTVFEDKKDC